jgi:spore maturation protein CgeB
MLKVLYLPLNDMKNIQQGMYDAFRQIGVDLSIYDFHRVFLETKKTSIVDERFLAKVKEVQPQLIHMQLQFTGLLNPATILKAKEICPKTIITNWTGDVRSEAKDEFVSIGKVIDHSLISSVGQLDLYRAAGLSNVKYWQVGYSPTFTYPMHQTGFRYDVSFIANNYNDQFPGGALRLESVNRLKSIYNVRFGLFGSGYPFPTSIATPAENNQIYNNSMCCLSISNFNDLSHYFSDRLLSCLSSGRPTITWHFPGVESYFVEGSEIFVARSTTDILDAIEFCRKNPGEATKIGLNGHKRVSREHNYTSRILELLEICELSGHL